VLDNLAAESAKLLYPAATDIGLKGYLNVGAGYTGAFGAIERTGKKGLHFMSAQASVGDGTRAAQLIGGQDANKYISVNTTHNFYISIWGKTTRNQKQLAVGTSIPNRSTIVNSESFGMYGFYRRFSGSAVSVYPQTAGQQLGLRDEGAIGMAPSTFQNIARAAGFTATAHTPATNFMVFRNGNAGMSGVDFGISESHIFYRYYIEDLTVSGRTYAQVDAIDYAEYTKQVKTVGGRYYGDTYSDPAVVTP
jgi:hypothetical protein